MAFLAGWIVGRFVPHRGRWVGRATLGCVALLLVLVGASFRTVPFDQLIVALPYAVLLVSLALPLTAFFAWALRPRRGVRSEHPPPPKPERAPSGLLLLAALLVGIGLGRLVAAPTDVGITWALYALLALVAFGLDLHWAPLRRAWAPIVAAAGGAVVAATVVSLLDPWQAAPVFASSLAFGWYSLATPLVTTKAGAALGLFAFVTNFLRESATIVLAPQLGPRLGGEGLTAVGGATSMDTSLYFVVRYGDPDAGSLALASGFVLTAAASLLVPLVLSL